MTNREKAKQLCEKMTLREKIGQITQPAASSGYRCYDKTEDGIELRETTKRLVKYYGGAGAVSGLLRADPWSGRCYGTGIPLEEREKAANTLQSYVLEQSEWQIPALIEVEASHGMQALGSMMYPTGLCCGASFEPKLYGKMMELIGREIVLSGNHIAFVTMIDLARDPRWGRSEECLGEDPCHATCFIEEGVKGLKRGGAMVCVKHFFGAGACEGGSNAAPFSVGEREEKEIGLLPAKAAVKAGADLIMVAYNSIDGVPMHFSWHYLTEVLRKELGFEGIILSDGCGIDSAMQQTGMDAQEAARQALLAGIDVSLADMENFSRLEELTQSDEEVRKRVDEACVRVLTAKYDMGLFENPYRTEGEAAVFARSSQVKDTAYQMAAESVTLLKNDDQLLPLAKETRLCLLGENAENMYYMLGDYTSERRPEEGVTIKAGLVEAFPKVVFETGWSMDAGCDRDRAVRLAEQSEVICLCMGGSSVRDFNAKYLDNGAVESSEVYMDCGEGCDASRLALPEQQLSLLRELKAMGKKVVAVLIMGRAYVLKEVLELADAVLVGWYPGQEGGQAIADVISGKVNPSGRLPVSLPAGAGCLPVCYNNRGAWKKYVDEIEGNILLPFGYGLSYSHFVCDRLQSGKKAGEIFVSFEIENKSGCCGKTVAQLYVKRYIPGIRPRERELLAFQKIEIAAHERITVSFRIETESLRDCVTGAMPQKLLILAGENPKELMQEEIKI